MKNMNMKKRYWTMNLQVFAEGEEPEGEESEEEENPEEDDEKEDDQDEEKKFSQKDVDDAVKKRLAREKRKWQREQQKKNTGKKPNGEGEAGEDEETQELRNKAARVDDLELKWTCLEHDVDKSCVDDVIALAKVYMAKDEDTDIEDAIDAVLKKYPQFKESSKRKDEEEEDETQSKSWGQRQKGKPPKKMSGVEKRFYELNPDLK